MKVGAILILILILTEISNTLSQGNTNKNGTNTKNITNTTINATTVLINSYEKRIKDLQNEINKLQKFDKPGKGFTAIIFVYLVLIIAGSILVLIFFKKNLEQ